MFNIGGNSNNAQQSTNGHGVEAQQHQQYLTQAFSQVLAQQILENKDELCAAISNDNKSSNKQIITSQTRQKDGDESSDIDFGDDSDDNSEGMNRIVMQRKQQLISQNNEIQQWKSKGHGQYDLIIESEFLPTVTKTMYCIIHFFHRDFESCKLIDKHLQTIAPRFLPVRICRIDAEKSPFFVDKLKIKVLPVVICFQDGKVIDQIVGFSDWNSSDVTSVQYEQRLKKSGIMKQTSAQEQIDKHLLHSDEKRNRNLNNNGMFRIGSHVFNQSVDDDDDDEDY